MTSKPAPTWLDQKTKKFFEAYQKEIAGFLAGLLFTGVLLLLNLADQPMKSAYIGSQATDTNYINIYPSTIKPIKAEERVLSEKKGILSPIPTEGRKLDTVGALININRASIIELQALSGIGPIYAQRIIENRPYKSIEEIMRVKGIGPKTFEKIKNKIKI